MYWCNVSTAAGGDYVVSMANFSQSYSCLCTLSSRDEDCTACIHVGDHTYWCLPYCHHVALVSLWVRKNLDPHKSSESVKSSSIAWVYHHAGRQWSQSCLLTHWERPRNLEPRGRHINSDELDNIAVKAAKWRRQATLDIPNLNSSRI